MAESKLHHYEALIQALLQQPVYAVPQSEKETMLLPILNTLEDLHRQRCPTYNNIQSGFEHRSDSLETLPYLAVRLFKHLSLQSIPQEQVFKVLTSSGTTSQTPSQIFLDKETSARQSKVLVKILQETLGRARLPMLIIDSPAILRDKAKFSARAAGIQGMAFFGRDHTYALDENMQVDWAVIESFCQKYAGQPVLLFGFTFMVWQYFVQAIKDSNRRLALPHGIMLHSGGWKNLEAKKVDNAQFKRILRETTGIGKVHNFYGMAEQVGSIFVECEAGHLHSSVFADVIVRNPFDLAPVPRGEQGLIQVISTLPSSYPGHSILTEDLGTVLGVDDCPCGQKGKYFKVSGRLPKTEVRGCSDTHKVGGS